MYGPSSFVAYSCVAMRQKWMASNDIHSNHRHHIVETKQKKRSFSFLNRLSCLIFSNSCLCLCNPVFNLFFPCWYVSNALKWLIREFQPEFMKRACLEMMIDSLYFDALNK